MPKIDGLSIAGTVYVKETDCRRCVDWALKNGRQPIFDQLVAALESIANIYATYDDEKAYECKQTARQALAAARGETGE